jgi:hypothetical protein
MQVDEPGLFPGQYPDSPTTDHPSLSSEQRPIPENYPATNPRQAQAPFTPSMDPRQPSIVDPLGLGAGAYPRPSPGSPPVSTRRTSPPPQPNPLFLDGYRNILEQLLGGVGTYPLPNGTRVPTQGYPPPSPDGMNRFYYGEQPFGGPGQYGQYGRQDQMFGGEAQTLGGNRVPFGALPPPQLPRHNRRFHYSFTSVGPDGRVRTFTNDSTGAQEHVDGRQIPVPTLNDFLGMHRHPEDPREREMEETMNAGGPLGSMLRQVMERMIPVHGGNLGDYAPAV